jgi:hypothetical protein
MRINFAAALNFLMLLVWLILEINAVNKIKQSEHICYIFGVSEAVCDRFQTWSDVNKYVSNLTLTLQHRRVNVKPLTPIVFTDQLDVGSFWLVYNGDSTRYFTINILEINGIKIFPWNISLLQNFSLSAWQNSSSNMWQNSALGILHNSSFNSSQIVALAFEQ